MKTETKLRIALVFALSLIAIAAAVVVLVIHTRVHEPIDLMIMYFAAVMLEIFCCVHIYRIVNGPVHSKIKMDDFYTEDVAVSK